MFNFLLNTFLKTTGSQEPINTTKTTVELSAGFILFMFFVIAVVFFIIIVAFLNMREKMQDLEKKIEEITKEPQNLNDQEPN